MKVPIRFVCSTVFACLVFVSIGSMSRAQSIQARNVLIRLMDEVSVPARAAGALSEVVVSEGTVVTEGQILAQIDDAEARLNYERAKYELQIAAEDASNDSAVKSAEKSLAFAKAHYERLYRADKEQPRSVSESELEKARLELDQAQFELQKTSSELRNASSRMSLAKNALALAERNLEVRRIVAPQDGVVVESLHNRGEWVEPGEKIFRIVSTKRLRAQGFVKSSLVQGDLKGMSVVLKPQSGGLGQSVFPGKVVFVSPEIDPVNDEVLIYADVENHNNQLRPGLRVSMSILLNAEQGG